MVFTESALTLLVDVMGVEGVLMGSDYPYPLGERPAGHVIRRSALPDQAKDALLGGNALRFLGL